MKLTAFRPASPHAPRVEGATALNDGAGLDAFGSETQPARPAEAPVAATAPRFTLRIPVVGVLPLAIVGVVGLATGAAGMWIYHRASTGRAPGTLKIETSVPGAEVTVGGKPAGRTPVSLALAPGSYAIQLASAGGRKDFTVDLAGGTSVVRHVDLPVALPAAAAAVGSLLVQTEPARLVVSVDGVERGPSPLTLTGLTPGEHHVAVRGEGTVARRTVTVQPNERTVLVLSPVERAAPAPVASVAGGWFSIAAPFALTIREGGKLLGSTDSERLMLPAGEHTLELSNEALGFQAKRSVRIEPGKTAALKVDPPNGILSVNAQPWAEVWVDGQRVGETPIGNLARPIGQHEIVLRHPDLGERRETVTITLRQPTRLGVDMRRK